MKNHSIAIALDHPLPEGCVGFVYVYDLTAAGVVIEDPLVLLPGESIREYVIETLGYDPEVIAEVSYVKTKPEIVEILRSLDKAMGAEVRTLLSNIHAVGVKTGEYSGTDCEYGLPTFTNFIPEQHEGVCSWPRP